MVNSTRVNRFQAAAQAAGAEVLWFPGVEEAQNFVSSLLDEGGLKPYLIAPDALGYFPGKSSPSSPMLRTQSEWMGLEVCLVRADYGVSETGTLVHLDRTEEERLIWTLPACCICFLSGRNIVEEAEELVPAIAEHLSRGDLQSPAVSFVTGPSRTADIEGQLVCGVHGPKRLIILILESPVPSTDEKD
ncbi:MAG: LutC/YkgG family protein [Candidatus Aminicenantales bacterium]